MTARRTRTVKAAQRALAAAKKIEAVAKTVLEDAAAEHVATKARIRDGERLDPNALQLADLRVHLAAIELSEARASVVRAKSNVMLATLRT